MSTLTVTTIQADLQWEDKAANLRHLEQMIDGTGGHTELVILPEMFSTGFSMRPEALAEKMNGPTVNWMRETAARKKIILTGSVIIEEDGDYFNRLIWMLPNGQMGCYDKRHRFAYAGEDEHYTAGTRRLIASVKGWRVLLLVCYDLRFPVWSRQQASQESNWGEFAAIKTGPLPGPAPPPEPFDPEASQVEPTPARGGPKPAPRDPMPSQGGPRPAPRDPMPAPGGTTGSSSDPAPLEYDLIIYVANWPERRSNAWKTLLVARAIENQAYVIGVNRVGDDGNKIAHSGDTMIVDPLGEVLYHAAPKEVAPKETAPKGAAPKEAVHTETLTKDHLDAIRQRFPFWRDADHFHIEP